MRGIPKPCVRTVAAAGSVLLAIVLSLGTPGSVGAQSAVAPPLPETGDGSKVRYQAGMILTAQGGGVKNILGTLTVPCDWPGQQRVEIAEQELPPGATVAFRKIEDVGRQMVIRIPSIAPGAEVRAVVTYAVEPLRTPPPEDVERFTMPDAARLERSVALHLTPSPWIESDQPEVRKTAREVTARATRAWEKVQAIHAWVHEHVKFQGNAGKAQSVVETLHEGIGDCDEIHSLVVAMCRAMQIPARLVRVPGHCYYEFYLLDGEGIGHWLASDASRFPSLTAENRWLGVILQKGDKTVVPDPKSKRKIKDRFLADTVVGLPQIHGARLQLELIGGSKTAN